MIGLWLNAAMNAYTNEIQLMMVELKCYKREYWWRKIADESASRQQWNGWLQTFEDRARKWRKAEISRVMWDEGKTQGEEANERKLGTIVDEKRASRTRIERRRRRRRKTAKKKIPFTKCTMKIRWMIVPLSITITSWTTLHKRMLGKTSLPMRNGKCSIMVMSLRKIVSFPNSVSVSYFHESITVQKYEIFSQRQKVH